MSFVIDWAMEQAAAYATYVITAGGIAAASGVNTVASTIESSGNQVGSAVQTKLGGYGNVISTYGEKLRLATAAQDASLTTSKPKTIKQAHVVKSATPTRKALAIKPVAAVKKPSSTSTTSVATKLPGPAKKTAGSISSKPATMKTKSTKVMTSATRPSKPKV